MKKITFEEAEILAMETDYARFSVGEEINLGDAAAFFLEGYNYALKMDSVKANPIIEILQQNELSFDDGHGGKILAVSSDYYEGIAKEIHQKVINPEASKHSTLLNDFNNLLAKNQNTLPPEVKIKWNELFREL